MKNFLLLLLSAWLASLSFAASAQVWKYIDADNVVHFTNVEPPKNSQLILYGDIKKVVNALPFNTTQETGSARRVISALQSSAGYHELSGKMVRAGNSLGVDEDLIKAVAIAESSFNPQAVSPKGAVGIMQIMPGTAHRYGVRDEPGQTISQKLKDPLVNIEVGTRYLADLLKLYGGNLQLVLAAYNAGEGAVKRAGNQIPDYKETRHYVSKVLTVYSVFQNIATGRPG